MTTTISQSDDMQVVDFDDSSDEPGIWEDFDAWEFDRVGSWAWISADVNDFVMVHGCFYLR
jgi:hypothetical protein